MIRTEKIYYQDSFLNNCEATVINIQDNKVILDKTM